MFLSGAKINTIFELTIHIFNYFYKKVKFIIKKPLKVLLLLAYIDLLKNVKMVYFVLLFLSKLIYSIIFTIFASH